MPDPAAATLDYEYFVNEPDGSPLPQSTAKSVVHDMVAMLGLRPGHRVLEVGTGSGYSAARLAVQVGSLGRVVSLDVDAALVARAAAKHAALGTRVEVHEGNGMHGWPAGAPFDRVVGWATPSSLPSAWVEQVAEGAIIVTPIKAAPVAAANLVVRCSIRGGGPTSPTLHTGSFIEMHDRVITEFGAPVEYVDAIRRRPFEPPAWLSCPALRTRDADPGEVLDRLLVGPASIQSGPFAGDEQAREAFFAYLYAAGPVELGSASLGGGWGIGAIVSDGAALIRPRDSIVLGTGPAEDILGGWVARWRSAGSPGLSDLGTSVRATTGGWEVRLVAAQPIDV
jgi:protein-L-isoaspartate(D-aspartate) O-methyltransferase